MKTNLRTLLFLLGLIGESLILFGCASTAHGISQDYHSNEDRVEKAVK
jgi:hypothetical protein